MEYVKLGNSEIEVSELSLGTWGIVDEKLWGKQDRDDAVDTIKTAYKSGINFFDTAEAYGDGASEKLLGEVLKDVRKEVVIASKVLPENLSPKDLKKSCENSLKRLNTDYIDIYYIHWPNHDIPFEKTMNAMKELKKEGKIRAIGCSNFGKNDLKKLIKYGDVIVNQVPYNLIWRAIEFEIKPLCEEKNIGITTYSSLAQALLTGKYRSPEEVPDGRARSRHFSKDRPLARHGEKGAERLTFETLKEIEKISDEIGEDMVKLSIAWILSKNTINSVTVGARNPQQILANIEATNLKIPKNILKKLDNVTKELKNELGKNPDMWEGDSRYN